MADPNPLGALAETALGAITDRINQILTAMHEAHLEGSSGLTLATLALGVHTAQRVDPAMTEEQLLRLLSHAFRTSKSFLRDIPRAQADS